MHVRINQKRETPPCSESLSRIDAPTDSGVIRSFRARTGAPACASTTLTPSVRSSVLLPDMFDPLTTSTCGEPPNRASLRTACAAGSSGWQIPSASNDAVPVANSGNGSPG